MTISSLDFFGPNAGYVAELYERYQTDPGSVDAAARQAFDSGLRPPTTSAVAPAASGEPANAIPSADTIAKIVGAARIARFVRELGHLDAHLDPLGGEPPSDPALQFAASGLTDADLAALPASVIGGPLAQNEPNAKTALAKLRRAYSGFVGYEDDHIQIAEERNWLREAVESGRFFQNFGPDDKRAVLERLTEVDGFEQFLDKTPPFQGQKRFSIEGSDMMVPILDTIIRCTAESGTREVVLGMAHRGRLNVLTHVMGKPYAALLSEFPHPGNSATPEANPAVAGSGALGYTGDVKYHKGFRRAYSLAGGKEEMPITLAPNPSHLEFVNPAVSGRARAAQDTRHVPGTPKHDPKASLAIEIHGDAAFPGQGVVAETLNMGQIPGYSVGGTIHIIANNQIGFTTAPKDGRSTLYASDLAKGFEIPIVHVNADEPEACIAVARMACAYHSKFGKDFLIDLIGYRRLGHNEGEEPAFTQPRMYEKIRAHKRVRQIWAEKLEAEGIVSEGEAQAMVDGVRQKLLEAKEAAAKIVAGGGSHSNYPDAEHDKPEDAEGNGTVSEDRLRALNTAITSVPNGFTIQKKVVSFLDGRKAAMDAPDSIVWAHAEALALGTLLEDDTPIRMTGQDTERGTFTQRHLVLHDPETGAAYCALQHLPTAKASLALYNSPLSETAALGFEYGYSVHATDTLVLWEAQFGDFVNGAQVILDQFIVSGNAKWNQSPSVVLLLPHGYEGQGPEHSSARLERFLQLCADGNLRVVVPSTPAQYFHLLRRQAALLEAEPRPLIVMTPKGLLRHPRVASSLSDLAGGAFKPVLDDPRDTARKSKVTRLVLCSGKVYVDLVYYGQEAPEKRLALREIYEQNENVAVARIEELYPFPEANLRELLASYPNLREVCWVQEEPRNMGAWSFLWPRLAEVMDALPGNVSLSYIGRPESASPAEGSQLLHNIAQNRIIEAAYVDAPALPAAPAAPYMNGTNGSGYKNGANGVNGTKTNGNGAEKAVSKSVEQQRTEKPHVG